MNSKKVVNNQTYLKLKVNFKSFGALELEKIPSNMHVSDLIKIIGEKSIEEGILKKDEIEMIYSLTIPTLVKGSISELEIKKNQVEKKDDSMNLLGLGIKNNSTITVNLNDFNDFLNNFDNIILQSGGMELNNLQNGKMEKGSFSKKAPDYRIACDGLNIEGKCKYKDCRAFGKLVIHQAGYGLFEILSYAGAKDKKFNCPICKQYKVYPPTNYYFTKCKFDWEGEAWDSEKETLEPFNLSGEAGKDEDYKCFVQDDMGEKLNFLRYDFNITKL